MWEVTPVTVSHRDTETTWSDGVVATPGVLGSWVCPAVTPRPPGTFRLLSPCRTPDLLTRPGHSVRTGETDTGPPTGTLCLTNLPARCLTPTPTLTTNTTTPILSTIRHRDNNSSNTITIMSRPDLNLPPTPPPPPQCHPINRLIISQLTNRWNISYQSEVVTIHTLSVHPMWTEYLTWLLCVGVWVEPAGPDWCSLRGKLST